MRFRIDTKLNDGKAEAPAHEITFVDPSELLGYVEEELESDEGVFVPVGATITLTRLA